MTYGPMSKMWERFATCIPDDPEEITKAKLCFFAGANAGVIAITEALADNHTEEEKTAIIREIGEEFRAFNDSVNLAARLLEIKIRGKG